MVISLTELRQQFEKMAKSSMFIIDRLPNGEYQNRGRSTFLLWAGYWECAVKNGIVVGDDRKIENMLTSDM